MATTYDLERGGLSGAVLTDVKEEDTLAYGGLGGAVEVNGSAGGVSIPLVMHHRKQMSVS